jgi:hypothetical protein
MNYLESSKEKDIFAVLKMENRNLIGRVMSISDTELVFHSVSDNEIPLDSFQHIDVFAKGHIYFRDLPVKVVSDSKIQDDRSFCKTLSREVNVTYNGSEVDVLIPMVQRR